MSWIFSLYFMQCDRNIVNILLSILVWTVDKDNKISLSRHEKIRSFHWLWWKLTFFIKIVWNSEPFSHLIHYIQRTTVMNEEKMSNFMQSTPILTYHKRILIAYLECSFMLKLNRFNGKCIRVLWATNYSKCLKISRNSSLAIDVYQHHRKVSTFRLKWCVVTIF